MSVSINYLGRFGNHMCQYAAARKFAEDTGRALITGASPLMRKILDVVYVPDGVVCSGRPYIVSDLRKDDEGNECCDQSFERICEARHIAGQEPAVPIRFHGFFSDYRIFRRYGVSEYFKLPAVTLDYSNVCMHVRLGDFADYRGGVIVDPSYYLQILESMHFDRLHIVSDEWCQEYFDRFKAYDPIIHVGGSPAEDFHFMRRFERMIVGNSSFAWWAAILGAARQAHAFGPWAGGQFPCNLAFHPSFTASRGQPDFWPVRIGFVGAWEKVDAIPGWLYRNEARAVYETAKKLSPHSEILQIGAQQGRTTAMLAETRRKVHVVDDFPEGPVPGSDQGRVISKEDKIRFLESVDEYMQSGLIVHIDKPLEQAKAELPNNVGMAFIDVFHDEGRAYQTYKTIEPYLAPDAWIIWHDYQHSYPAVMDAVDTLTAEKSIEKIRVVHTCAVTKRVGQTEPEVVPATPKPKPEPCKPSFNSDYDWTILTMSKGRNHHLELALPSMLAQPANVLLIDYDCPDHAGSVALRIAQQKDYSGHLDVFRFDDRPEFYMPEIINKGFELAQTEWVFILGIDMMLQPNFIETCTQAAKDRHHVDFDTGKKPNGLPRSKVGYYGAFGLQKKVFQKIGGYDLDLKGYGYADTDFKIRMAEHGINRVTIPESLAKHIEHGRDDRLKFYSELGNKTFQRNQSISAAKARKREKERLEGEAK